MIGRMSANRPSAKRRRLDQVASWQFDMTAARPLLDARLAGREVEWGRDGLERFLGEVRIAQVNDAALKLFALPTDRRRVCVRPIGSLWPESSHAPLADLLAAVAASGLDDVVSYAIGRMDRWKDVLLRGWRSGDPRCPDLVFVSIEAALDAPEALLELEASEHRYRALIASLPLPVWEIDARAAGKIFDRLHADGVVDMEDYSARHPDLVDLACELVLVTDANTDAVKLMGAADSSDLLGPVKYIFADAPGAARRVMIAHFNGQRNHVEQVKVRNRRGELRDVLLLVTLPVPGERLDTTLLIMIDNTARIEAEARLRQVEADFTHAARLSTLGQMTASIAHEVKQPLSAILTNAETILRWLAKPDPNLPKVAQLTERIAAGAQRANDIIVRIQDTAGKRQPRHVRLDLNEVIGEALTFVRHDNEERSINLRVDLDRRIPPVVGDRIQLQQVVVNLLVNSGQAVAARSTDSREIWVRTFLEEPQVVGFSIRDNGPGIPAADLDRIFGGFFSTKEGGMGIGLTICQTIIAGHGGQISASNHPEGGAEFRVTIPTGVA